MMVDVLLDVMWIENHHRKDNEGVKDAPLRRDAFHIRIFVEAQL